MSVILWSALAWAACPADARPALRAAVDEADAAFADLRFGEVAAAVARADAMLPCADGLLEPVDAARLHRAHGLVAMVEGDTDTARAAFGAARRADPSVTLDPRAAPPGSPIADVWAVALTDPGEETSIHPARGATWRVDGMPATSLPTALPSVVQLVDRHGAVIRGAHLPPGAPLPDYALRWGVLGAPSQRKATGALLGGTAVTAVGAGVLYGLAVRSQREYWDADTPDASLGALRKRTNALSTASAVSAGAAVALGASFVVVRY